ncbi:HTH domain-containing protein [Halorientalis brevis]|uniref:HTH domain-containing protein n=1 Tax=Halorientalis brevis TaxID=1126241 RepID=A0ABD6CE67_9EURY|nr:HTH domain-containing protein [Halorientalis brevis]
MKRSSNQSNEWWEEKTSMLHAGHSPRVKVFLRSLAPPMGTCQQQNEALEQLQSFERQGLLDSVDVTVWGKSICPDSAAAQTEPGTRILDYVDEFTAWGARTGSSTELPFEEQRVSSSILDEQYQKIVLPQVCFGVYTSDQLELVLPCEIDGESYGVEDFIRIVEQQSPVEREIGTSA